MKRLILIAAVAAFFGWAAAAHAVPVGYYYVVGIPQGDNSTEEYTFPIQLVNDGQTFDPGTNQWSFSGDFQNNTSQTYHNVLILLQFVFNQTSALVFNDAANIWSGGGDSMTFPGLDEFLMANTNAPLSFAKDEDRVGSLLATDTVPYVQVGDVLPGESNAVHASFVGQGAHDFDFDLAVFFVSTDPVPEPATFAMLAAGGLALLAVRRRHN